MIKKRKPKKVFSPLADQPLAEILGSGALQIGQAGIIHPELVSGSLLNN